MKQILFLLLISFLSNSVFSANKVKLPVPPVIKAKGYIILDYDSGQIITQLNADQTMEPASITKMMTSYIVSAELEQGNISLTDRVTISEKAWRMKGSRMFIEEGKKITVEQLLKGLIVQSGNDATIALAEHIAGDEDNFVQMMNKQARELGMDDTNFVNATGLPHGNHFSTPRDLAALGRALIHDYPDHYKMYAMKEFRYNKITQKNRNKLLWKKLGVDGIKTGHTESAGYCLVASAKHKNMRLISVVLGTRSKKARTSESEKLLRYGFKNFETYRLYSANQELTQTKIWKGETDKLPLGLTEDLYITIPKGTYKNLDANMSINAEIVAPIARGQTFGTVNIKLGKKNYAVRKLTALSDIRQGSFWRSMIDSVMLAIE